MFVTCHSYSFDIYFVNSYYVLDKHIPVLGTGAIARHINRWSLCSHGTYILVGDTDNYGKTNVSGVSAMKKQSGVRPIESEGGLLYTGGLAEKHTGKPLWSTLAIYFLSLLQNWDCLFRKTPPINFPSIDIPFSSSLCKLLYSWKDIWLHVWL